MSQVGQPWEETWLHCSTFILIISWTKQIRYVKIPTIYCKIAATALYCKIAATALYRNIAATALYRNIAATSLCRNIAATALNIFAEAFTHHQKVANSLTLSLSHTHTNAATYLPIQINTNALPPLYMVKTTNRRGVDTYSCNQNSPFCMYRPYFPYTG
jgi:hypothetical protein